MLPAIGVWLATFAGPLAAQAPQGPPVQVTVTVTAEEARRIRSAVRTIEANGDPLLADLAKHLPRLADTMVSLDRVFTLGPLTAREQAIVDLHAYLVAHQEANGPIRIQVRSTWTDTEPVVFRFTTAGLLSMLAAVARGPRVQVPELQREQVLWLGRAVLDLNWQAGGVIADKEIFAALTRGFRDKSVGTRLVGIIRTMTDTGTRYDLVPRSRLQEFHARAEPGFLIRAPSSAPGTIKLKYGEVPYATRPDHLLWSFLRMFAGDNSSDWAQRAMARERSVLARAVLDYLEAQIRMEAIADIFVKLAAPPPGEQVVLGTYRADGPVATWLDEAPGVTRSPTVKDPELLSIGVRTQDLDAFKRWLAAHVPEVQAVFER